MGGLVERRSVIFQEQQQLRVTEPMKTLKNIALGCVLLAGSASIAVAQSNSTVTKELILKTNGFRSLITTGAQTNDINYTLPTTTPSSSQVLTASTVSGNNVTLGWAAAGGTGVTYGPGSQQATLTPVTTKLFDVAYASGSGNAAGANIQSTSTGGTATGLTVGATGTTSASGLAINAAGTTTVTGATLSATGGTSNYALIVPSTGGRVGIGNSAPAALLSVGSTSQLQVDANGVLKMMANNGTNYSTIDVGAQTVNLDYTLPTTTPTAGQILTATSVAAPAVTLGWSGGGTTPIATLQQSKVLGTAVTVSATTSGGANTVTGLSFSAESGKVYKIDIYIRLGTEVGTVNRVNYIFTNPGGTFNMYIIGRSGTGGGASHMVMDDLNQETANPTAALSSGDAGTPDVAAGEFHIMSGFFTCTVTGTVQLKAYITGGTSIDLAIGSWMAAASSL